MTLITRMVSSCEESLKLIFDIINAAYIERFPSGPPLEERNGALGGGNDWGPKNPPAPPLNWRCLEPVLPDLRKCIGKEPTRKSPNESVRSIVDRRAEDPFLPSSSDEEDEEYPDCREELLWRPLSLLMLLRRREFIAIGSDAGIDMGVEGVDGLIDVGSFGNAGLIARELLP